MSALDKWLCFALEKLESKSQSSVLHRNRLFLSNLSLAFTLWFPSRTVPTQ